MSDKSFDLTTNIVDILGLQDNNFIIFTQFWTVYFATFEVIGYSQKVVWVTETLEAHSLLAQWQNHFGTVPI